MPTSHNMVPDKIKIGAEVNILSMDGCTLWFLWENTTSFLMGGESGCNTVWSSPQSSHKSHMYIHFTWWERFPTLLWPTNQIEIPLFECTAWHAPFLDKAVLPIVSHHTTCTMLHWCTHTCTCRCRLTSCNRIYYLRQEDHYDWWQPLLSCCTCALTWMAATTNYHVKTKKINITNLQPIVVIK